MSRQRKWQLKQKALGRCGICGSPAATQTRCLKCAIEQRERSHRTQGCTRIYTNCASRRAENFMALHP